MNTSNKRLKIGASFPCFYFLQITRLARLPLLTPRIITYDQSLPAKNLPFQSLTHPDCELPSPVRSRRVPPGHPTLPFRLYLSDSESWSPIGRRRGAPSQTTLPFPPHGRRDLPIQTTSIFLLSDVGESLPATHLTFLCLYLSNAASLDLPLDAGEVLPARQSYYSVFTYPTQQVLISRWTPARCSRPDNLTFFCLYLSNTASLDLPLDTGEVLPARQSYLFCLYMSDTASLDIPLDAGEVLPARQSYFSCLYLSNTASLNLPLDAGEVLPARQSYFSCLYLSNTASLNLPLDAGEVLPARQTLFRLLAPKYRTPSNATYPAILAILAFSPPPARFDHPAHEYQSHVGCRKSLPAGQPHLFLLRQRS